MNTASDPRVDRRDDRRRGFVVTMARSALALLVLVCCVAFGASTVVQAQSAADVRLYGKVTHSGATTRAGDRVLAYDINGTRTWIGPALTDDYGAYAFYNLAPGPYVLRLYVNGKVVWNNQVTVRASATRYDITVDP